MVGIAFTEFQAPLDYTKSRNRLVWRYYYGANNVIQSLGGNDQIPELEASKHAMGQAKALRAYNYFYNSIFSKKISANEEILPLYLEPISENVGKSTAVEIYEQMEKDLNEAISL